MSKLIKQKITIGLDLGTDNCCITYQDNIGRPFIITDDNKYKISSVIGILNNGLIVGNEISKENIYDIPIITNLKRLIGRKANDFESQIIASYNNWTLEDSLNDNDLIICISENNKWKLNDLMCILLKKIKQIIISNIGENFNLIITIPANFNEGQKNQILSYCKQCDIECKRLIYEPCAAALTYINYFHINSNEIHINSKEIDLNNLTESSLKHIIVFDFGAGTLDLAIVTCNCILDEDDNTNNIEWMTKIESHIGDNNLGGIDIDMILGNYLEEKYPQFKKLLEEKKESNKFIIEKIKIKLSKLYELHKNINVNLIERYYNQILMIDIKEYFNLLNIKFKDRIIALLDNLHNSNKIKALDIDIILLVGGSCYNPWIKELISEYYNKKIHDYKLILFDHIENYNLDIKEIGVSLGATCVDKKINKNGNNLILTESLPLSIGIETINNIMCKIIPKGSLIPFTAKKYFTTSVDNQTIFEVKLYQGERDDIRDNFFLGSFIMDNLEPEPQGKLVLIINISVTTDGLITLEGKVKNTEKYNKKMIINRYNVNLDDKVIDSNIKQYELNDYIFGSIINKYYTLLTMLNRLQYNLLDDITSKLEPDAVLNIIDLFWNELIIIHKLMSQSNKLNQNIEQLTKFILYVENKLKISDITKKNLNIELVDDKIIGNKLDILIKFIEKNLQHLVSTYQIKADGSDITEGITETAKDILYDTLDENIKLTEINSIKNSTEILNEGERNFIKHIENFINTRSNSDNFDNSDISIKIKSNIVYFKEINDLILMIINEIDTFQMGDYNKLLILNILDIYDNYLKLLIKNNNEFNGILHIENIKNLCMKISSINNNEIIQTLLDQIDQINIEINIEQFQNIINNILLLDQ